MGVREEIAESAARVFYVEDYAWAAEEERDGWDGESACRFNWAGPGEDWMNVAPPTPNKCLAFAERFLSRVSEVNSESVSEIYRRHVAAHEANPNPWCARDPTPELFGYYLAMMSLGTGVEWYDDYPVPEKKLILPDVEYYPVSCAGFESFGKSYERW